MNPTLWSLKAGDRCEILGYDDALAEKYRIRLMEFGFHVGECVTCLQSPAFGAPKVYQVSNTIYSLDDEVATHVLVRTGSLRE
ncbi:FeoA family protein [Pseudohalioglobus lutimaris]|uniref:Ferrous iron transport protein A n=1 Tax=Pseudohalioglobus lutimaris TaxID=1737061 RepID=A0A2N5X0B2_9GAMM|nr:FeoA family protein [Pseudohalioglobus lutimaris]PLW67896.1 ferrous iron transport protein A [Pseudohalioglobus lutimaris]